LSHIRQVDAICQVVRCFEDENITHVSGKIDPTDDIETINLELVLADLETVSKRYDKAEKMDKQKDKDAVKEFNVLNKLKQDLEEGKHGSSVSLTEVEGKIATSLHFLNLMTLFYVDNVTSDEVDYVEY